jgi:hypothetical protein
MTAQIAPARLFLLALKVKPFLTNTEIGTGASANVADRQARYSCSGTELIGAGEVLTSRSCEPGQRK